MKLRTVLTLAGSLLAGPAAAYDAPELSDSQRKRVTEWLGAGVVETVTVTAERQEQQRKAGQPVLRVEGLPVVSYREAMHPADMNRRARGTQRLPLEGAADVHGCVVLSFEIRPDGKTDQFELVSSAPKGLFDKQALRTLLVTEYEPQPAVTPRPRYQKAFWFMIAQPPPLEWSALNETKMASKNRDREALRASCEKLAP